MVILAGVLLAGSVIPKAAGAFPLRPGEDCFYGEGEPTGEGVGTWMGYAVEFEPPYTPYTVDGVSLYISRMWWAGNAPRLWVAVLDEAGILRQYAEIGWEELDELRGWILIPLTERVYGGRFTVVVNSGVGLPSSVSLAPGPLFQLGVDTSDPAPHSFLYTSDGRPPRPDQTALGEQGRENLAKLASVRSVTRDFPSGNWMIRAHAPGLQMESTRIVITQESLERWIAQRQGRLVPEWHLPPIEGFGPRGTVHCPTSLSGVTFYYYEEERERKFLYPHQGPWAHPDLIATLGAMCRELNQEGIVGIEHIGIYNDRYIYGTNTLSSHAFGLGIDITGFQYADGRTVLVEDHDDPATRRVLEHIRDDYLRKYFTTVLDWTYQRHDNHFHVNLPYTP